MVGRLADVAFGERALRRAWSDVLAKDSADGHLTTGVTRFEEDLEAHLERLVADLAWAVYEPRDLTRVVLEEDPNRRVLHVPAVVDRVVERAILEQLTPLVDPVLGPAAYGYRPGLGVADAVEAVVGLREEGLGWVLRADVDDCFPTIPVGLARRMLGALVDDEELLAVVDQLLSRRFTWPGHGRRMMTGLAQGSPISPLLSNLVLSTVDGALLAAGFPIVRYADDIIIATASREEAWEAARCLSQKIEELGMQLGVEDTQVMSFQEGFTFLGEDFGPRYPPVTGTGRVQIPERKVLYAALQGGRVRIERGRVIVESSEDVEVLDVPSTQVRRVVCFGAVGFSAGARTWAMSNNVDVVFASRRGTYLGSLLPGSSGPRVHRLRAQIAFAGTAANVALSRAIVEAKVRKQIVALQRFARREHAEQVGKAVASMRNVLMLLPDCRSTEELMGVEGAAAAAYFPALGNLLPEELRFQTRSRQPPLDLANSALSFLYTVLLGECVTALTAAGLDPSIGVLHADDDRRPSLALDLLEEFRPLIVDQVVLTAARTGALKTTHARGEDGRAGVFLTRAGREVVLDGYERRMLTRTGGALPDFSGTLRRHLYRQAQRLQAAITGTGAEWSGMSWR